MAVLSMRRYGDPILRLLAAPVAAVTPEIKTLIADMAETMWHQVGIGLAAPQIGVSLRIFVMDDGKRGARAIVNPVVTDRGGVVKEEEGCLSLPGIFAEVERCKSLRIEGLDGEGQPISFEAQGLQAKIIQHELDHLDGVLFIDRLPPVTRDRIKKKIQKEGLAPEGRRHHAFAL
jgi:peptide deformylase